MSLLEILFTGLVIFVSLQALFWHFRARKTSKSARLMRRLVDEEQDDQVELGFRPQRLARRRGLQQFLASFPLALRVAALLEQAGVETTVANLLGQMIGCNVLTILVGVALGLPGVGTILLGFFLAFVPVFYVLYLRAKRVEAFEKQIPQALALIGLFLKAGRSLPQAFTAATEELSPPISVEFGLCAEEYRMGRPINVALGKVVKRFPHSAGLRAFVMAISILGQTGGNLVEVIENIRKTIEIENRYMLRLRSLTGESRMTAYILGLLPGGFLLITLLANPDYIMTLFVDGLGRVFLGFGLFLWLVGILWLRYLLRSKPI